jgi:hypothetical protein
LKDGVNNLAQVVATNASKLKKYANKMPFQEDDALIQLSGDDLKLSQVSEKMEKKHHKVLRPDIL